MCLFSFARYFFDNAVYVPLHANMISIRFVYDKYK